MLKPFLVSWSGLETVLFAVMAKDGESARNICSNSLEDSCGHWNKWEAAKAEIKKIGITEHPKILARTHSFNQIEWNKRLKESMEVTTDTQ